MLRSRRRKQMRPFSVKRKDGTFQGECVCVCVCVCGGGGWLGAGTLVFQNFNTPTQHRGGHYLYNDCHIRRKYRRRIKTLTAQKTIIVLRKQIALFYKYTCFHLKELHVLTFTFFHTTLKKTVLFQFKNLYNRVFYSEIPVNSCSSMEHRNDLSD